MALFLCHSRDAAKLLITSTRPPKESRASKPFHFSSFRSRVSSRCSQFFACVVASLMKSQDTSFHRTRTMPKVMSISGLHTFVPNIVEHKLLMTSINLSNPIYTGSAHVHQWCSHNPMRQNACQRHIVLPKCSN